MWQEYVEGKQTYNQLAFKHECSKRTIQRKIDLYSVQSFEKIPVQMCQFHQVSIIRRYLTKKPKLPASIELKEIVDLMKQTDKESFKGALNEWFLKWECFLKERTVNIETSKSHYTHKRLRSAYRSLNSNLKWLFTWYDFFDLKIPNTTNAIDGHFADLKNKLRNHNGLSLYPTDQLHP